MRSMATVICAGVVAPAVADTAVKLSLRYFAAASATCCCCWAAIW